MGPWKESLTKTRTGNHQCSRKSSAAASVSSADCRMKGNHEIAFPDVLQSTTSSTSSLYVVQVGTLPRYLDQWQNITSNRFVFSTVKCHHLQLGGHPLLFYNFKWLLC